MQRLQLWLPNKQVVTRGVLNSGVYLYVRAVRGKGKYMENKKGAVTQEREGWTPKTKFART